MCSGIEVMNPTLVDWRNDRTRVQQRSLGRSSDRNPDIDAAFRLDGDDSGQMGWYPAAT
jgi:hypothetical protein